MAMKDIDIEALNNLVPELPKGFEIWCKQDLPTIPIYYRRNRTGAECTCGKCGTDYMTEETPIRYKAGKCTNCGHIGRYEWKKALRGNYYDEDVYLLQKMQDGNLIYRVFNVSQFFKQYKKAKIEIREYTRYFLTMGEAYRINYVGHWKRGENEYAYEWTTSGTSTAHHEGRIYPGYVEVLKDSNLRYCDIKGLEACMRYQSNGSVELKRLLVAYANNPAIEMYAKAGMDKLVRELVYRGGKKRCINRRGKNLKAQLRLQDKQLINRVVAEKGDTTLLEILQYEQKNNVRYTEEQEGFLKEAYEVYHGKKKGSKVSAVYDLAAVV